MRWYLDNIVMNTGDAQETDKVLFDFVSCETFGQAVGAQPMTTNALIRAATVEYVKVERGLCVIVK